jgi:hypothetical protein
VVKEVFVYKADMARNIIKLIEKPDFDFRQESIMAGRTNEDFCKILHILFRVGLIKYIKTFAYY